MINAYPKNTDPVKQFLSSIGVANVDANGQATGTTGGNTFMWQDQQAQYRDLVAAQPQQAPNAFLPGATPQPQQPAAAPTNTFLPGAPTATGDVRFNGLTPATLAPGGTPMLGRDYGSVNAASGASGASSNLPSTPLSTFGQRLLATGGTETRDGAVFSGAGGKLSITQDMGSVPMGGKPSTPQFDPMAVARYQQALAAGGDVAQTLQAFRTEVPKDVQLSEQEMAALAMDDMRINQQAMEVAKYVNDRGMTVTVNQPQSVRENRMAYIGGLASQPAAQATGGAADVRARLNQRPIEKVEVTQGDEVVTYDKRTGQELGRAPRTSLPAGYERAPDGSIRPMAGSKDSIERADAAAADARKREQTLTQADAALRTIDEVMPMVGTGSAGLGSGVMGMMRGTNSANVKSLLDTIKANLGFAQLSALREASKTGGALGQVSERENELLQSTIASLSQEQSPLQLRRNLYKIKYHYERIKDIANGVDPDNKPGPKPLTPEQASRLDELRQKQNASQANSGRRS